MYTLVTKNTLLFQQEANAFITSSSSTSVENCFYISKKMNTF